MPNYIPQGFICTPEVNARYAAIRRDYLPLLKSKANFAAAGGLLEAEDLIQDLEMATVYAVAKHDPDKGSLLKWIGWVADNVVRVFLAYAYTLARMPRIWELDVEPMYENGGVTLKPGWKATLARPTSLEFMRDFGDEGCMHCDDALVEQTTPETMYEERDEERKGRHIRIKFRRMVDVRLKGFANQLFWARLNPPTELLVYIRNRSGRLPADPSEIQPRHVARFYGYRNAHAAEAEAQIASAAKEVLCLFSVEDIDYILSDEMDNIVSRDYSWRR